MMTEQLLSERHRFSEATALRGLTETQRKARALFMEKVSKDGGYTNVTRCPYCGHDAFVKISEVNRRGIPSDVAICEACDGCFKVAILNKAVAHFYYENISLALRGKLLSDDGLAAAFEGRVMRFAYPRYRFITLFSFLDPHRDLIVELGCNDGANLVPWVKNGYKVLGVDLDPRAIAFGRAKKLNVTCADFLDYNFAGMQPRLVILSHVLGHMTDLDKVMDKIASLLPQDGYLFIETPGIRFWDLTNVLTFFDVECNYYFDKKTLTRLLERHRFNIIYTDEFARALCVPVRGSVPVRKDVPFSIFSIAAFALKMSFNITGLEQIKLLDLLKAGENGSIRVKVGNALQHMYYRYLYKAIEKNGKG